MRDWLLVASHSSMGMKKSFFLWQRWQQLGCSSRWLQGFCHFSMVSGYSSRTCMIRHCLKNRRLLGHPYITANGDLFFFFKGTKGRKTFTFFSKAQWKVRSSSIMPSSSLALDMEGILLPLLPLLDQQLTQPYLLVQYQSFLYCKKKGYAGTDATTGALPPPLLEVSRISYWSRYSCYHNEGTSAKESAATPVRALQPAPKTKPLLWLIIVGASFSK